MAKTGLALFEQTSTGGVARQISPIDTMIYSAANPGLMFALVYIMWAPFLYPGAHMVWAILTVSQMFVIAGLYWLFSVSMPRSGGEYIYISRILHPSLGLMASFMITFTSISWTGILLHWIIKWSIQEFFYTIALINGNDQSWLNIANFFDSTHIHAIIGTLLLLFILFIYYKGTKWMVKLAYFTLGATILGAITFIVANLVAGQEIFATNFTELTGLAYEDVISLAQADGYPTKFLFGATVMAGSTYIILNTLGSTFGANLAGEVRNVQKSQLLALFGSLAILMAVWAIFYGMSYVNFGDIWSNSLYYLYNAGHEAYPFEGYDPFVTIMIGILTKSPIFVFLIAVCFAVATFGSAAGLGFGPTRNIVAWSFDRLVPKKFMEVNKKTNSPVYALWTIIIGAWVFLMLDIYLPTWTANIGFTIFTWFLAWIFLGIAGITFTKRRKILFNSSPPVVKTKIFGVHLITILGWLTFLISVSICYYLLIPFFKGDLPFTMIVVSLLLMVIPITIYFIMKRLHAKKGVDIDIQFQEIPSD
ncbi:APC family permease [Virgibacillus oceani]|uniref:Amino acid transporter n=1 Tax=Virgibacillus oceani TaxID=1479511 RepID=A0A917HIQ0_9BACI|nr:APC family permease [Virgibacillus oceani]GGG79931.1 amino acid transporter [Virgibacillus oceani]